MLDFFFLKIKGKEKRKSFIKFLHFVFVAVPNAKNSY